MGGFGGTNLGVKKHITSYHIPLVTTQSHDHTELQGRLGSVVSLCAPEKEEVGFNDQLEDSATIWQFTRTEISGQ